MNALVQLSSLPPCRAIGPSGAPRMQIVPLSDTVSAAFFDLSAAQRPARAAISARSGAASLCLPLVSTRLPLGRGGCREVVLLRLPAGTLIRDGLWLTQDALPLAELDPDALQSPLTDPLALIDGLAPEGAHRLVRVLLTTGLSLFGTPSFGGFQALLGPLLGQVAPAPLPLRTWCPLGRRAALASYAVPEGIEAGRLGDFVCVGRRAVRRLAGVAAEGETVGEERLLHLYLPEGAEREGTLVALSPAPLRLAGPTAGTPCRPAAAWFARRSPPVRRRMRKRLARLAEGDARAAALWAELAVPAEEHPSARIHHLSATPAGLFFVIAVEDRHALLAGLVLESGETAQRVPLARPVHHPRHGRLQIGFAGGLEGREPGEAVTIFLLYRSGRMRSAGRVSPGAFPTLMPPILDPLPPEEVAPALAAALGDAVPRRAGRRAALVAVAAPAVPVRTALVVTLGAALDYPFALAASLGGRLDVSLILHHPDPDAVALMRGIGQEIAAIHGIGVSVADLSGPALLPSERMRALLGAVEAPVAVCLGEDALPDAPDWLARMEAALDGEAATLAAARVRDRGGLGPDGAEVSTACLGLNRAARALLRAMPLGTVGAAGDVARLIGALREGGGLVETEVVEATAFDPAPAPPEMLRLADARLVEKDAGR